MDQTVKANLMIHEASKKEVTATTVEAVSIVKEWGDSVRHSVGERIRSPLLGTYTVLLIAFNWRFLVVLFTSPKKGAELIADLEPLVEHSGKAFALPLLFTAGIVALYPLLKLLYVTFLKYVRNLEKASELAFAQSNERLEERIAALEFSRKLRSIRLRPASEEEIFELVRSKVKDESWKNEELGRLIKMLRTLATE